MGDAAEPFSPPASTVYGPVRSWRVGASLGIDLLFVNSICSFNCSYCQLGNIREHIRERRLFVPTQQVMADLERSHWREATIVTFSGSGEPTLALNLGEAIRQIRDFTGLPILVLTNGTTLNLPEVRQELAAADQVYVKLDAASEEVLQRVNRPVAGITLAAIVEGMEAFRREYPGRLGIQTMLLHGVRDSAADFARILEAVRPDEIQINTPTRPYPRDWHLDSRGSHERVSYPAKPLKPLTPEALQAFADELAERCPWLSLRVVGGVRPPTPSP